MLRITIRGGPGRSRAFFLAEVERAHRFRLSWGLSKKHVLSTKRDFGKHFLELPKRWEKGFRKIEEVFGASWPKAASLKDFPRFTRGEQFRIRIDCTSFYDHLRCRIPGIVFDNAKQPIRRENALDFPRQKIPVSTMHVVVDAHRCYKID